MYNIEATISMEINPLSSSEAAKVQKRSGHNGVIN